MTARQKLFLENYFVCWNGAEAARKAGYAQKHADKAAVLLMSKPAIKAAIEKKQEHFRKKFEITQERVLNEYAKIAFSNIGDVMKWSQSGIKLKDSEDLEPEQKAAIEEISETSNQTGTSLKVKLYDKKGALDSLSKYLGLFKEQDINANLIIKDARSSLLAKLTQNAPETTDQGSDIKPDGSGS